jgi:hypothetical protein
MAASDLLGSRNFDLVETFKSLSIMSSYAAKIEISGAPKNHKM